MPSSGPPLGVRVSADGRGFETADGKPFFWLAETSYSGVYTAAHADVDEYLKTRKEQGFTVIKTLLPYDEGAPDTDSPSFFPAVDYALDRASQLGLQVVLMFRSDWPKLAVAVGKRYANRSNVMFWVWESRDGLTAQGTIEGVMEGVTGQKVGWQQTSPLWARLLMASYIEQDEKTWSAPWTAMKNIAADRLDEMVAAYNQQPIKPVVRTDGAYETHPYARVDYPDGIYRHVFSGVHFTYGFDRSVWDFSGDWRKDLQSPGAKQCSHYAAFFSARKFWRMVPDQSVIGAGALDERRSARSADGDALYAFLPDGKEVDVDLAKLTTGSEAAVTWLNPLDGTTQSGGVVPKGQQRLRPPWAKSVLVVDAR